MIGTILQRQRARAVTKRLDHIVVTDVAAVDDQADILAGTIDCLSGRAQRQILAAKVGQDQVRRLSFEQVFEFGFVAGPRGAHGNTAIAQHADDLFGFVGRILDQQQLDHIVCLGHEGRAFREVRSAGLAFVRAKANAETCTGFTRLFPYSDEYSEKLSIHSGSLLAAPTASRTSRGTR